MTNTSGAVIAEASSSDLSDPQVELKSAVVRYGDHTVLGPVDLTVGRGEFVAVVGASGSGKSTLLNAIGGHVIPVHGEVRIAGELVTEPHPAIGTVFQRPNLFPWMDVLDNVAFGLRMKGVPEDERRTRAREMLRLVGLEGCESKRPYELSGGMQQRVALARALAMKPAVLLMDEPFGALDAITRTRMQHELLQIWEATGTTILFITHDVDEAMLLGQRVVVIAGKPGQFGEVIDTSHLSEVSPAVVETHGDLEQLSLAQTRARILDRVGVTGDAGNSGATAANTSTKGWSWSGVSRAALTLTAPLLAFVAWLVLIELEVVAPTFLPPPSDVLATAQSIFIDGYRGRSVGSHLWASLSNVLIAFAIATVVGVPLGWLMGLSRRIQYLLDPVIEFIRPVPPLAYLTLLVIWLGVGQTTQITLLVVCGIPLVTASARSSALSTPKNLLSTATAFGANRRQQFRWVVMPASLPEVMTGLRVTMGILFATVVAAEMVAARGGIGWMILDASRFLRADVIFVGIFLMVFLGFTIDRSFRILERVLVPWRGQL